MDLGDVALLLAAGLVAGVVNAVAGGGSLVTFPALIAVGLPPVTANVTNSVAVSPGYLASVVGSRAELAGQGHRVWHLVVTATLGAAAGSLLLLRSPERAFELVVPFLVLGATALLAFQDVLRRLVGHPRVASPRRALVSLHAVVALAGLYGGYFRPALGVVLIALLALVLDETMPRLNALKNVGQAVIGVVTVAIFALFGPVEWLAVAVLVPTTIAGGYAGARLARRIPDTLWRVGIVGFGATVGVILLVRTFT
jgi:uncharacterized membrane protein YfcA